MPLEPVTISRLYTRWLKWVLSPPGLTDWDEPVLHSTTESLQVAVQRGWWEGRKNSASLIWPACCYTFTNTHTHSHEGTNMRAHTQCKVHCRGLTHKEQECYIFITDGINTEGPMLSWGVLIAQQKRSIRSINQWFLCVTWIQTQ